MGFQTSDMVSYEPFSFGGQEKKNEHNVLLTLEEMFPPYT
jgi:hypothetical protein